MNGTLAGLIAILMWSFTALIFAFVRTTPIFEVATIAFFVGYLSMTGFQIVRKEDMASYWNQPISSYLFWLSGAGIYTVMIYFAMRIAPIFEANILNYVWPILLVIFASILNGERLTPLKIIGMAIGFFGVLAVMLPDHATTLFEEFTLGHILAISSAILWAFYSARAKNKYYPSGFLGPAFLVFAVICLACHLIFEKTIWPEPMEWILLIFLGIFRVSYVFWDYGMKKGDVILLASICYFLPLASSILLITFGFGPSRPLIWIGAGLIIMGCIAVNFHQIKKLVARA